MMNTFSMMNLLYLLPGFHLCSKKEKQINQTKQPWSKITVINSLLVLLTFSISCQGQSKAEKLDQLSSAYAEYGNFNGSILVAEKGHVIYKKGFGMANMELVIPNQADTKHRIASMSKQFTSMLILQLASENKLKLDVPISNYLSDYPKKNGDIISIHHLLTHSSGIPNYTNFPNYRSIMSSYYSPKNLVELFADSSLQFKPGEKFEYSNSGYVLLGYIIEKITGKTYKEELQERIFTPLHMNSSGVDDPGTILNNRALGYYRAGNTCQNANFINMSVPFSAGSIYSTVEDLYLWDQALYTEQILPKKYMDLFFQKHIQSFGLVYYAYGWEIAQMPIGNTKELIETIGHSGTINGFNSLITRIVKDKNLIVLLNNTGEAPLDEMTIAINGILYDKPYNFPKKSVAYSLLKVIKEKGIPSATNYYKAILDSSNYRLIENEMNSAGYELLQSGKVKEAAFVFKLNVETFPNSFNVYDSYGESLLALGDKAQAIENYKKSVQLNPSNENGLKVLIGLGVNTDSLIKKVSLEYLKLLEGEYVSKNGTNEWKIEFKVVNGELMGNDQGYRYKVLPVGENTFVNPDDGASLVFDTKDKGAINLLLFGKFKFNKL
ncbi:MAG: serine hydrolase [Saprospiraceae bacterium]